MQHFGLLLFLLVLGTSIKGEETTFSQSEVDLYLSFMLSNEITQEENMTKEIEELNQQIQDLSQENRRRLIEENNSNGEQIDKFTQFEIIKLKIQLHQRQKNLVQYQERLNYIKQMLRATM